MNTNNSVKNSIPNIKDVLQWIFAILGILAMFVWSIVLALIPVLGAVILGVWIAERLNFKDQYGRKDHEATRGTVIAITILHTAIWLFICKHWFY